MKILTARNLVYSFIIFVFVAVSLYIIPYHEFWADEVQAFLIARDADWEEIFTIIPYQEGQPVLWHILLKIGILLFGADMNMAYLSLAIMTVAVGLLVFKYDIPLAYKVLIPFGYYFMYQYNIMARNYCLAYLGLILVGLFYRERHQKIWPYILSLALLAESTTFYFPVAAALGGFYLYEIYFQYRKDYKKYIYPLLFLILIGISVLWQILPFNHFSYISRPANLFTLFFVMGAFFASTSILTTSVYTGLIGFYLIYKIIKTSQKRVDFNVSTITYACILWGIFLLSLYIIHPVMQHRGLIWGLFLFSLYTFCKADAIKINFILIALFLLHIQWNIMAYIYEKQQISSPQTAVLEFLKRHNLDSEKILPIGYQTLPFQAIYPRNQLALLKDETVYYKHTTEEYNIKHNLERLLNRFADIVLVDNISERKQKNRTKAYKLMGKYFLFIFYGSLNNKGAEYYRQKLYLYIDRDLFLSKAQTSF